MGEWEERRGEWEERRKEWEERRGGTWEACIALPTKESQAPTLTLLSTLEKQGGLH